MQRPHSVFDNEDYITQSKSDLEKLLQRLAAYKTWQLSEKILLIKQDNDKTLIKFLSLLEQRFSSQSTAEQLEEYRHLLSLILETIENPVNFGETILKLNHLKLKYQDDNDIRILEAIIKERNLFWFFIDDTYKKLINLKNAIENKSSNKEWYVWGLFSWQNTNKPPRTAQRMLDLIANMKYKHKSIINTYLHICDLLRDLNTQEKSTRHPQTHEFYSSQRAIFVSGPSPFENQDITLDYEQQSEAANHRHRGQVSQ